MSAAPSALSSAGAARPDPRAEPIGDRLATPPQGLDELQATLGPGIDRAEQPQRSLLLAVGVGDEHSRPQPACFLVHALQRADHQHPRVRSA